MAEDSLSTPAAPGSEAGHGAAQAAHAGDAAQAVGHADVFPPFDPSTFGSQLFWLAVTFGVLYFVLSRVALPRIGGIIEARRLRVDGDLKEAERLRLETEKAVAAYEAALSEAKAGAGRIAEETRTTIRGDIDRRRAAAEAELAARLAEAESRIAASKAGVLANVDAIAADTALALVAQLGGEADASEVQAAIATVTGSAR